MLENKNFFPTPPDLASRMVSKIKNAGKVLEPSAGKGDLIEALKSHCRRYDRYSARPFEHAEVHAIEKDPTLQATLRGKGIKVLDSDFLEYAGPDKFDTILANPPFDEGDKHLLKAIEIMYRGQIVFLLNAETLRNPFSNIRKELTRKLDELGAEIEYIPNAFVHAERKTKVEVALVNIVIDRKVEEDLFADCDDHASRSYETVEDKNEISTGKTVEELVAEYNERVHIGTEVILTYFRNHRKIGGYLGLNQEAKNYTHSSKDLTAMMQDAVNDLVKAVRVDFWRRTLDLKEVRSRLTSKKQEEFEHALNDRCHMDFTASNIRQFVLNLIGSYEQTLTDAVLETFDFMTRHGYRGEVLWEKNIHYFNGWKTNDSFKVGKRVVLPIGYEGTFQGYRGWELSYKAAPRIRDIDLCFSYFDGGVEHLTLEDAMKDAFTQGENTGESTYFHFKAHKKGTLHLNIKDDNILRRFNLVACRGKGWLPDDYGKKAYGQLTHEERAVADAFDGKSTYEKNVGLPAFAPSNQLRLCA